MKTLTSTMIPDLLRERDGPCLSLYQNTHRHHPDNAQDPIRFANLVKEIEASLKDRPSDLRRRLLEPFERISEDTDFWSHTLDGLVVLSAPGESHVLRIPRPVTDFSVVADSWHLKPLLRIEQTTDRFQVLCLTRQWVRLYEGNRDGLAEIDIAEHVPASMEDALGSELTEPYQKVSSYGMGAAGGSGADMRHGHGGKKEEIEKDTVRFFRIVERAFTENCSRPSGLPLILASLPEHQGIFRSLTRNPLLLKEGISLDPASLSMEALRESAWRIMEPVFQQRIRALVGEFAAANAKGLASGSMAEILAAALEGRVSMLLVEGGRQIPGRLDIEGKQVEYASDFSDPATEDLLDDMVELVMRRGGTAWVLPKEVMPAFSGIAAIYRY